MIYMFWELYALAKVLHRQGIAWYIFLTIPTTPQHFEIETIDMASDFRFFISLLLYIYILGKKIEYNCQGKLRAISSDLEKLVRV